MGIVKSNPCLANVIRNACLPSTWWEVARLQQAGGGQGPVESYVSLYVWLGARQALIRIFAIACAILALALSIIGIVYDVESWASWATLVISVVTVAHSPCWKGYQLTKVKQCYPNHHRCEWGGCSHGIHSPLKWPYLLSKSLRISFVRILNLNTRMFHIKASIIERSRLPLVILIQCCIMSDCSE
jgi:hypothetical protein